MKKRERERCVICNKYLMHKLTILRGVCKLCEPDMTRKFKITQYRHKNKLKIAMEYKLL